MLVFDHGWHQLAVAMSMFGDVTRIFAWLGRTEIVPGIVMDAPSTLSRGPAGRWSAWTCAIATASRRACPA